jgi:hypothetical protein
MEERLELGVDEQTVEQTSVVAVHGPEKCVSDDQQNQAACRRLTGTNNQEECMQKEGWWSESSG